MTPHTSLHILSLLSILLCWIRISVFLLSLSVVAMVRLVTESDRATWLWSIPRNFHTGGYYVPIPQS